jgi:hypothetical protein
MHCHGCNTEIPSGRRVARQDPCPACGVPLHCCMNCRFFSETAHHRCLENQAEFVSDKAAANFCDWFEPAEVRAVRKDTAEQARKKLDALFGGKKQD